MGGDKNTIIGFVLIALLFLAYNFMLEKEKEAYLESHPEIEQTTPATKNADAPSAQKNTESIGSMKDQAAIAGSDSLASTNTPVKSSLFIQNQATEKFVEIENEDLKLTFSSKGARLYKAELKNYKTSNGEPLILLDGPNNKFNYRFHLDNYPVSTQDLFFDVVESTSEKVLFKLKKDNNTYLEQEYSFNTEKPYMINYDLNMVGFDKFMANSTGSNIELEWKTNMIQQEKSLKNEQFATGVYFKEKDEDVDYLSETADDSESLSFSIDWVGFKQQFFNHTLIAGKTFSRGDLAINAPGALDDSQTVEVGKANLGFIYRPTETFQFPMEMYIGPNSYSGLKTLDKGMEKMIPLGWGIFGWVNKFLIIPIFTLLSKFIGNYGIIILILTLVIKLALFPLTRKSYVSFAKMNALKPDIAELKEKYGKDPQKMQQEQMKLYSSAGVNPLGGCLPQIIQLPILIAMYRFFPASIELRQQSFLWAEDLSTYDSIFTLPFEIPWYGAHVSLFCLLSAVSQMAYMRLNNQMTPSANDEMAKQMRMFQYIMPVMLLFFFNNFAAALTWYFLLSTLISFAQQYAIKNYFIDEKAIRAQIQENKKKPQKKSKFQARMEEMMKQQQAQQRAGKQGKNKKK